MDTVEYGIAHASRLMTDFAERTGLVGSQQSPQRYLWTDAFAVCNFLGLARLTGESRYLELARHLVDQVHHVLGRYRTDDARTGWLSGLDEREGEAHPTRGGLRIGKPLPERQPEEPLDHRLEWDRDGQYFHYLTKWMHALDQVSRATGDPRFNLWARELAEVAHATFTHGPPGRRQMVWKMSTDLSRPLVPSMGQHDPLDGLITCVQLEATRVLLSGAAAGPGPRRAVEDFAAMLHTTELRTDDPLGLGGLLSDAGRVAQLGTQGAFRDGTLLESLLTAALEGLSLYSLYGERSQPASRRLAFRELGLAIGLSSIGLIQPAVDERTAQQLMSATALGSELASFWLAPEHRAVRSWTEHRDINEVMLATSLVPEGYLVLEGFGGWRADVTDSA
ncbi:hypothetical protein [Cystobacter ferrugineus]|uniref:Uncharacterized protein n=1 Tax=Cystobacter ferrugineus TaxID=83449 RepID=A0A1L9B5L3_9BACT|nr:hypothetical protein [Cystobacter ferrugineus]OJH37535.1 hypothetical protein BON30_29325 [Cystobacter ferrugineus]